MVDKEAVTRLMAELFAENNRPANEHQAQQDNTTVCPDLSWVAVISTN